MSLSNQSSFTVEKAVFNLSTALRKKNVQFLSHFLHTHMHTYMPACTQGRRGKEGRKEKENNTKNKREDAKNTRRKSWKASLKNSEIQGRKHQRNKSHTKSSRIRLASNIQHQKTVQQCLQSPPQKKEGPETMISQCLPCKHRPQNHFQIFKNLGNISHIYILQGDL